MRKKLWLLALLLMLIATGAPVLAQNGGRAMPLTIQFSTVPQAEPVVEQFRNQIIFKIETSGDVTGDFEGKLTQRITQVAPLPEPALEPITTFFSIETDKGTIEGYYSGYFYLPGADQDAQVQQHGQVLSVTGQYADLYLANVYMNSVVNIENGAGVGDSGSMTIVPAN